jgi:hypothetical protein
MFDAVPAGWLTWTCSSVVVTGIRSTGGGSFNLTPEAGTHFGDSSGQLVSDRIDPIPAESPVLTPPVRVTWAGASGIVLSAGKL